MKASKTKLDRAAAALRSWRTREALTVAAAAEQLDLTAQVWSTWEHGAKRPTLEHALQLDQLTRGAVRYEWWDYSGKVLATVAQVVADRARAVGT